MTAKYPKPISQTDIHIQLQGCKIPLTQTQSLIELIRDKILMVGFTPVNYATNKADINGGVTIAIILLESHVVVHTWPEIENSVTIDICVCNYSQDNTEATIDLASKIIQIFEPKWIWMSGQPKKI